MRAKDGLQGALKVRRTRQELPFVHGSEEGTTTDATVDIDGQFTVADVQLGLYNKASGSVGEERLTPLEVRSGTAHPNELNAELKPKHFFVLEDLLSSPTT